MPADQPFELHGTSCFLRDGERVFHTYSTYGRGTDPAFASTTITRASSDGPEQARSPYRVARARGSDATRAGSPPAPWVVSATAAPPRRPRGRRLPPGPLPPTEPPPDAKRRPRVWRIVVGCLIVIALAATTTVVFIKGEIHTLASALSQNKALALGSGSLASAGFGDPQTILLVGNDQRKHTTTPPVLPHSNEMLLVRIDPGKPWISMMSIPRELEVTIQTPNGPVSRA